MKKIYLFIVIIILLHGLDIYSQRRMGSITGKVLDNDSKALIEYANIVLLSIQDSSLITGTVSDVSGIFRLSEIPFGKYGLEVRFIGFDTHSFVVDINPEKPMVNLGEIFIKPAALELKDVVVKGDRSPVSYQIDKKVIDVDKIQTVISGNAADVLQNVPSVTVDIEGNVSLRGSTSFTVLVDGKPSIMSAQDVLQQIPASSIQSIEIITNPSAKYDPEGTAGIINILLKKNQNLGLSGIINGNIGLKEKYGGDFLFQYRTSEILYTFGMDYNKRNFPGSGIQDNRYYLGNSVSYFNYNGNTEWGRIGFGLRAGIEFDLGNNDNLNIVGRYGTREGNRTSTQNVNQFSNDSLVSSYINLNNMGRGGEFAGTNLTYTHKFAGKGHEIKGEFNFRYNDGDDSSLTESKNNGLIFSGKKTNEFGPSRELETKIDYTLPLSETRKFEAGYENEIENSDENNELYEFNSWTGKYEFKSLFSNSARYKNNDQALYAIYSDQFGDFGIQGGLRSEYTFRKISLVNQNKDFTIDRWDFFPTIHTSYKFTEGTQMMASYTRRIQRPHGGELEPFYTWIDANNVRTGNPDLLPQLIDSYESGIQTFIGEVSLSAEIYHRVTNNRVEHIRYVYNGENVNLDSVANIGKDFSTGTELMCIFDPLEFWNVNLMANLYDYRIEGVLYDEPFSRKSFNWNSRINNMFKIGPNTQVQVNMNYNSPTVSSQGRWEDSYSVDVSVKQDFFERMLSLTLQTRDIFGTGKHEFSSSGPDFYTYNYFEREAPIVILNIRFNFNNYKPNREKGEPENGNEVEEF
jgi:outer membrane cobalamin receptor